MSIISYFSHVVIGILLCVEFDSQFWYFLLDVLFLCVQVGVALKCMSESATNTPSCDDVAKVQENREHLIQVSEYIIKTCF